MKTSIVRRAAAVLATKRPLAALRKGAARRCPWGALHLQRKTPMKFFHRLLAIGAAAMLCAPAFANNVVYTFSGSVDINASDLGAFSHFSGQFSFDSSAPDLDPGDPNNGGFDMSGGAYGMSVVLDTVPARMLTTTPAHYGVSTHLGLPVPLGSPPDYDRMSIHGRVAGSGDTRFLTIYLQRTLASDVLFFPPGGFTLADFDKAEFYYTGLPQFVGQPFFGAYGQLDTLSCVEGCAVTPAVPEPATYALLLAGLGAIGWVGRRRSPRA